MKKQLIAASTIVTVLGLTIGGHAVVTKATPVTSQSPAPQSKPADIASPHPNPIRSVQHSKAPAVKTAPSKPAADPAPTPTDTPTPEAPQVAGDNPGWEIPPDCKSEMQGLACVQVSVTEGTVPGKFNYYCNHFYDQQLKSVLQLENADTDDLVITCPVENLDLTTPDAGGPTE